MINVKSVVATSSTQSFPSDKSKCYSAVVRNAVLLMAWESPFFYLLLPLHPPAFFVINNFVGIDPFIRSTEVDLYTYISYQLILTRLCSSTRQRYVALGRNVVRIKTKMNILLGTSKHNKWWLVISKIPAKNIIISYELMLWMNSWFWSLEFNRCISRSSSSVHY